MNRDLFTPPAEDRVRLTSAERRFLAIIYPTGTVAQGSTVGAQMYFRGFVTIKFGRFMLTAEGAAAIQQYPESGWKMPQIKEREWRR